MKKELSLIEKPLVLIIEDDPHQAGYYATAMQEAGFRVHLIYDGATASDWLQHHVPALVLLDLHLPFVSGEKLLNQIRQDDRFAQTRVFIMSSDGSFSRFLDGDVELVLNKPVSFQQLQALSVRFYPVLWD